MRKFLKLFGVLVLFILILFGVVLFCPPIHKAALLWALNGKVEDVSVSEVRFSLSSLSVSDLRLVHDGAIVATDHFDVKAAWLDLVLSKKIHIDEILINGLQADLATVATAGGGGIGAWLDLLGKEDSADSDEPWEGILALMQPSPQVSVGRVRLDGQVLLPEQQSVDLNLSVDNLEFGKKARFQLQGAFVDDGEASPIDQAVYNLSMELDQTEAGEMNGIVGQLAVQMMGEGLNPAGQIDVNGVWNLSRTANGEILSILVRESGQSAPLLDTEMDMNVETGQINGRLDTHLKGSILPVSLLGLPPFVSSATLSSEGEVGWNYKTGSGQFQLDGAGVLEGRPWQYQFSGTGTSAEIPTVKGFVKTSFVDEAGTGELTVNLDVNSTPQHLVKVPVEVRRGNRLSRLTLETDVESLKQKLNPFQVSVNGETVFGEDLQSVGKALAAWAYSMQQLNTVADSEAALAKVENASAVPWDGFSGNANVSIKRLVLPKGIALEKMSLAATVRSDSVSLTSFASQVEGGAIRGKGDLLYVPQNPNPFTFRAEGAVANLPSGLVDLGSGAPITGSWTGSVSALGQASQIDHLVEAIQLSMDLKGTSGLLQLTRVNEGANQSAQVVNLGVALLGGLLKNDRFSAVSKMTQYLQRVPYDSIHLQVDRSAQGKVTIHDFSILGPELMLAGKGSVDAQSWASLAEGALSMNLAMGSKGQFGDSARALGLIGEDLNGEYQLWRQPINISGTLSNPDYSALKDMIFEALR